jgi:inner membrane transporter RhtA
VRTPPPQVLLLGSIASVQFGSAFAAKLFGQAGPGGVVMLRLGFSAIMLLAISRPSLRGRTRSDIAAAIAFGVILGGMNWSFYEALDRTPLGVAVTIEFLGPLAVAVAGSRRLLDLVWVLLAGGGVALLATRGDHHDIHPLGVGLALVAWVQRSRLWTGWPSHSASVRCWCCRPESSKAVLRSDAAVCWAEAWPWRCCRH